jgi:hypothetical protein
MRVTLTAPRMPTSSRLRSCSIVALVAKISFSSMRARAYRDALVAINALIGRACGPGLLALFLGLPLALCWARRLLKAELPRSCELLLLLCNHRRAKAHRDGKAGCHYQSPHREARCLLGFNPFARPAS